MLSGSSTSNMNHKNANTVVDTGDDYNQCDINEGECFRIIVQNIHTIDVS